MTTKPMTAAASGQRAEEGGFSPAEARIAAVWNAVLGAEVTGAEDEFFRLGGTLPHAAEMARRIAEEFGSEFGVEILPEPLTVRAVASFLAEEALLRTRRLFESADVDAEGATAAMDALVAAGAPDEAPVIPRAPRHGRPLPLSFAQRRLWFLDQLEPGRAEYLIPMGLRIRGPLDVPALRASLSELVSRHEVLRTRFAGDADGNPGQVVDPPRPLPLAVHDLRSVAGQDAREEEAAALVDSEGFRPMDLGTGPLVRALLIGWPMRNTCSV